MFQKVIEERDPKYLDFVRRLPCLVCGRPSVPHHQPKRGNAAKGSKASDYRAVPLCFGFDGHHMENGTKAQPGSFHRMSWPFYARYDIDVEAVILELNQVYFFGDTVAYINQQVQKWEELWHR